MPRCAFAVVAATLAVAISCATAARSGGCAGNMIVEVSNSDNAVFTYDFSAVCGVTASFGPWRVDLDCADGSVACLLYCAPGNPCTSYTSNPNFQLLTAQPSAGLAVQMDNFWSGSIVCDSNVPTFTIVNVTSNGPEPFAGGFLKLASSHACWQAPTGVTCDGSNTVRPQFWAVTQAPGNQLLTDWSVCPIAASQYAAGNQMDLQPTDYLHPGTLSLVAQLPFNAYALTLQVSALTPDIAPNVYFSSFSPLQPFVPGGISLQSGVYPVCCGDGVATFEATVNLQSPDTQFYPSTQLTFYMAAQCSGFVVDPRCNAQDIAPVTVLNGLMEPLIIAGVPTANVSTTPRVPGHMYQLLFSGYNVLYLKYFWAGDSSALPIVGQLQLHAIPNPITHAEPPFVVTTEQGALEYDFGITQLTQDMRFHVYCCKIGSGVYYIGVTVPGYSQALFGYFGGTCLATIPQDDPNYQYCLSPQPPSPVTVTGLATSPQYAAAHPVSPTAAVPVSLQVSLNTADQRHLRAAAADVGTIVYYELVPQQANGNSASQTPVAFSVPKCGQLPTSGLNLQAHMCCSQVGPLNVSVVVHSSTVSFSISHSSTEDYRPITTWLYTQCTQAAISGQSPACTQSDTSCVVHGHSGSGSASGSHSHSGSHAGSGSHSGGYTPPSLGPSGGAIAGIVIACLFVFAIGAAILFRDRLRELIATRGGYRAF